MFRLYFFSRGTLEQLFFQTMGTVRSCICNVCRLLAAEWSKYTQDHFPYCRSLSCSGSVLVGLLGERLIFLRRVPAYRKLYWLWNCQCPRKLLGNFFASKVAVLC